jgi:acyl-CoA hydrolase
MNVEGRTVARSAITMSQQILPHQAGRAGYAHGGEILKMMDTAVGVVAVRHAHTDVVTARVDGVNFLRPIKVLELVTIDAFLTFVGRTAMEVRVEVTVEDMVKEEKSRALTAYFTLVALDDKGKPTQVPPLILESDQERERWEKGKQRYERCRRDLMAGDEDYRACREEPAL